MNMQEYDTQIIIAVLLYDKMTQNNKLILSNKNFLTFWLVRKDHPTV